MLFRSPDAGAFPSYHPFAPTDALVKPAKVNGLLYVDLGPVFQAARPQRLFFRRDEHWNAPGQALAADHVAALVRERGLLK